MDTDFLDDGSLPLFTVSVRHCAAMIVVENLPDGTETDAPEIEELLDAPPHSLGIREFPQGPLLRMRDAVELSLCRDIDAGRLKTRQIRRSQDGTINTTNTLLDTGDFQAWANVYGLECGDTLDHYNMGEGDAANEALDAVQVKRHRLADPEMAKEAKRLALNMSEDEIALLWLENRQLKIGASAESEKPIKPREKNSLLRIIRALAEMAKLPSRGYATSIAAELERQGFDGPAEDTIRTVVAAARGLDP